MSRIDFKQVHKRYAPGLPTTIKNANLVIADGEFCVFVGPSGCGKSTLLRMVAGLEDITEGDLLIGGERVNDLPPAQRGVAMVFQSYALYPHMTVAENMAFGLRVKGVAKPEIERKVKEAANILQLAPLLDRQPKALSGGQRQRVAIGRAIVTEPKVFLFDEPLSNLDAALRVQTRLEIAKLHHDIGSASMIYVTHDQVEAMTLADKIVLLHAGKLVEERGSIAQVGSPMTLYHRPASLFVAEFIGSPKMNVLPATMVSAEAAQCLIDVSGVRVQVAVDARHIAAGAKLSLGFRPEHVGLDASAAGAGLPVLVRHVERLGDVSLLYVDYGKAYAHVLTVRVEGSVRPAVGTQLELKLRPENLHLFDEAGLACTRTVELPE
ncbi:fused maltose transport subunit, ATP-binding component of ABC superfamily; regulatory protein [Rubrivivax sp. A210]|uniref:ABC transporter ATP-binding protein n=1 Tax=Rubrivivax sp. A210 TaxID=2772301 RepID=UPI0019184816|nr:sn-glycerol-3-phosphate ABC transporter ATP-binding protein UgpC [Rubrivivax sp. A210]CAD5366244.1 fused maltose transport subunit, ATP-binding component of ABC superfamily; regulatory protein [Rubrivivax sp. A210]